MEQNGRPQAVHSADLRALDDFLFRKQPEQQLNHFAFLNNYDSHILDEKLAQLRKTVGTLRATFFELSYRWQLLSGLDKLFWLPTAEDLLSLPSSQQDAESTAAHSAEWSLLELSATRFALKRRIERMREAIHTYEADHEQRRRATEMREELDRIEFERMQQEEGSEFREEVRYDPRLLWPTWDVAKWLDVRDVFPFDPIFQTWVELE